MTIENAMGAGDVSAKGADHGLNIGHVWDELMRDGANTLRVAETLASGGMKYSADHKGQILLQVGESAGIGLAAGAAIAAAPVLGTAAMVVGAAGAIYEGFHIVGESIQAYKKAAPAIDTVWNADRYNKSEVAAAENKVEDATGQTVSELMITPLNLAAGYGGARLGAAAVSGLTANLAADGPSAESKVALKETPASSEETVPVVDGSDASKIAKAGADNQGLSKSNLEAQAPATTSQAADVPLSNAAVQERIPAAGTTYSAVAASGSTASGDAVTVTLPEKVIPMDPNYGSEIRNSVFGYPYTQYTYRNPITGVVSDVSDLDYSSSYLASGTEPAFPVTAKVFSGPDGSRFIQAGPGQSYAAKLGDLGQQAFTLGQTPVKIPDGVSKLIVDADGDTFPLWRELDLSLFSKK